MVTLLNNRCFELISAEPEIMAKVILLFMGFGIKKDNSIDQYHVMVFNQKEWEWLVRIQALKATEDGRIQLHPNSFIENPHTDGIVYPFDSDEFIEAWQNWKRERSKKRIKKYTPTGEQAQLHRIYNMCKGDESLAIASINESITQGYQGIFLAKGLKTNPLMKFFNTQNT